MELPGALTAIGVVHSPRARPETTPIQAALNRGEHATVEIFEPYAEGLVGLAGFSYAWLLCWLRGSDDAAAGPPPMTQVPFLLRGQGQPMGIFATRGPRRVNPIGLSLVRLLDVSDREVRFAGVDVVDATPVIDLKPYVAAFDHPDEEPRCGWFDTVELRPGVTPADLGPPTEG